MAEFRTTQTRMWSDEWFCEQQIDGKLLFHYLFTNPHGSVAGIYLLPVKFMAFDTGISLERVRELLCEFQDAGKIEWAEPVIWVKKMREHQVGINGTNTKLLTRIERDLWTIPDSSIKQHYLAYYTYPIQAPLDIEIPHPELATETETDTETDTDTETLTETETIVAPASPVPATAPKRTRRLVAPKAGKPAISSTPAGLKLAAKLRKHYEALGRDPPTAYKSPEMQEAFDQAITALDGEFDALTDKAFTRGIDGLDSLLSWYEGCVKRKKSARKSNAANTDKRIHPDSSTRAKYDPTEPKHKMAW